MYCTKSARGKVLSKVALSRHENVFIFILFLLQQIRSEDAKRLTACSDAKVQSVYICQVLLHF